MNILFTRFPLESRYGGAEVQTLALMKGLQEKGHTVALLGSCPVLLKEVAGCGLRVTELDIGNPPVSKASAFSFLWRKFSMKKRLISATCNLQLSHRLDVVVMLSLSEKLLLTPYLHKQGIKVIWVEHDRVGPWLTHNPWLYTLRRLSRCATTIVVSELSKQIYERLGFANVIAIPNGIDVSRLLDGKKSEKNKVGQEKQKGAAAFRIGTIARLSKDKGVDVLIEVVKDLENVSLTIVGTGPERQCLATQIRSGRSRSSATNLQIIDRVDNLHDFYTSLDLFILSSREHDPFGLVAGEAMMLGIPVIVTDACGIAGYLTNGRDAVITPCGSVEALRTAILDMKEDPEKFARMGAIGKRTAEEKFSMENMVKKYEEMLS